MDLNVYIVINQQMILDDLYKIRAKLDDASQDGREAKQIIDNLINIIIHAPKANQRTNLPTIRTRNI